jgi:hypothetical protein
MRPARSPEVQVVGRRWDFIARIIVIWGKEWEVIAIMIV